MIFTVRAKFFITSPSKIRLHDVFIAVRKIAISRPRVKSMYFQLQGVKSHLFESVAFLLSLRNPDKLSNRNFRKPNIEFPFFSQKKNTISTCRLFLIANLFHFDNDIEYDSEKYSNVVIDTCIKVYAIRKFFWKVII